MNIDYERVDDLRRGRGPIPEHVIDEFVGGRLSPGATSSDGPPWSEEMLDTGRIQPSWKAILRVHRAVGFRNYFVQEFLSEQ